MTRANVPAQSMQERRLWTVVGRMINATLRSPFALPPSIIGDHVCTSASVRRADRPSSWLGVVQERAIDPDRDSNLARSEAGNSAAIIAPERERGAHHPWAVQCNVNARPSAIKRTLSSAQKMRSFHERSRRRATSGVCGAIAAHRLDACDTRNPGRERPRTALGLPVRGRGGVVHVLGSVSVLIGTAIRAA